MCCLERDKKRTPDPSRAKVRRICCSPPAQDKWDDFFLLRDIIENIERDNTKKEKEE